MKRCLRVVVLVVGCCCLVATLCVCDTLKLTDGTVFKGTVLHVGESHVGFKSPRFYGYVPWDEVEWVTTDDERKFLDFSVSPSSQASSDVRLPVPCSIDIDLSHHHLGDYHYVGGELNPPEPEGHAYLTSFTIALIPSHAKMATLHLIARHISPKPEYAGDNVYLNGQKLADLMILATSRPGYKQGQNYVEFDVPVRLNNLQWGRNWLVIVSSEGKTDNIDNFEFYDIHLEIR